MKPDVIVTDTLPGDRDGLQDESDDSKYQVRWNNTMDRGKWGKPSRYKHVHVLLLYWHESCGDMSTEEEVDELKAVFEHLFQYHTEKAPLVAGSGGRKVQTTINRIVSTFIDQYDGPDNLLIVYYAGHGMPDKDKYGHLQLLGCVTPIASHIEDANLSRETSVNDGRHGAEVQDRIVLWNRTEILLKEAAADVFEIFDWYFLSINVAQRMLIFPPSCYAGTIGLTRGEPRYFMAKKVYLDKVEADNDQPLRVPWCIK